MLAKPVLDAPAVWEQPGHSLTKPEVLSPAGGWPQLRAAGEVSELMHLCRLVVITIGKGSADCAKALASDKADLCLVLFTC